MTKYVVFLRGVNTGGFNLKMADLQKKVQEAGYPSPETVLATGNIIIQSEEPETEIKGNLEKRLTKSLERPITCSVRSLEKLETILAAPIKTPEGYHHYLLFCESDLSEELQKLFIQVSEDKAEKLLGEGQDLHWIVKKGNTLTGFGNKVLGKKSYQNQLTSRNKNTIEKIYKKMLLM